MCNDIEDLNHLFDCLHVQYVWTKLSLALSFDDEWKHVILCFYFKQNIKVCFRIAVISFNYSG